MKQTSIVPQLSIIVALAQNYAIGKNNDLLWHISDDLKHFKTTTKGHTVIMGRNTWTSLPRRPLPLRRNIVLSHDPSFHPEGTDIVHSINELFHLLSTDDESFIIGGGTLYQQCLPFVSKLYVTWIHADFEADTFFPVIDKSLFASSFKSEIFHDDASNLSYHFENYHRISPINRLFFV